MTHHAFSAVSARAILVTLVLGVLAAPQGAAQTADPLRARLDAVLDRFETDGAPLSGTLLVGDRDGVLYQRSSGAASYELDVPVSADTRFRLASVSKQFAGALAVLLDAEGIVDLDAPIETYLPALSGTPAGATTLDLILKHRSGLSISQGYLWGTVISDYDWDWRANRASSSFVADTFLVRMAAEVQGTPPGEEYAYCNECYVLGGLVLTAASGAESYEALLHDRILRPLGMASSGLDGVDRLIEGRAVAYERAENGPYPISRWRDLAPLGPAGGMIATAGDLQRWAEAVFHSEALFSPALRARFLPPSEGSHYGLSRVTVELDEEPGVELIYHTGQIAGTYALVGFAPAYGVHLVVLSNVGFTFPQREFQRAVVEALYATYGTN